jgi:hypothetical protein
MQITHKADSGPISHEISHFSLQYIFPYSPPVVVILVTEMLKITFASYKFFPLIDIGRKWLKGNETVMQEM